ncbi:Extradiol aromatic ring-opening dioxygenase [Testicularia cyperi]|uniref:Extradiol aromatic ring-opening dioxygenase n=1 Tax=Testicularia cyperi TaxID=1882483 RepID=A0A317XMA8_9BASI|nr:Extradiol aromatic ring-opening dioxygenase [Testicularia cyperi]
MTSTVKRAPSYFIGHGGPPTMFQADHPAYKHWLKWGKEVRELHQDGVIRGLVFVSAHWQADELPTGVFVNVKPTNPLIYDFYGFPAHFYKQQVSSSNPASASAEVISVLKARGVTVHETDRGIDHGVWCPLRVAFQQQQQQSGASESSTSVLPATLSLTQVSLPRSESSIDSLKLGVALRDLRDRGYAIVGGGMAVHNLRDFRVTMQLGAPRSNSYSASFLNALTEAMTVGPASSQDPPSSAESTRWSKALALEKRPDFRPSHPTAEHFLPALVAFGAAHNNEQGVETLALDEGPMGW